LRLLDEPTNHLDIDSREALIHAVNDYEGAVILISHDRHLIETTADRLWLVEEGTVKAYDGDIEDYTRHVLERVRVERREKAGSTGLRRKAGRVPPAAKSSTTPATALKKIREIDAEIEKLHEKISVLDRALADERLYSDDPQKAQKFSRLRAELQNDLEACELRWLEAHSELEGTEQ
jgi:ATP-binding cassette, subfamily F, member 3